ncbi:hypothetical protein BGZ94_002456, partial [Podila epigama]
VASLHTRPALFVWQLSPYIELCETAGKLKDLIKNKITNSLSDIDADKAHYSIGMVSIPHDNKDQILCLLDSIVNEKMRPRVSNDKCAVSEMGTTPPTEPINKLCSSTR